MRAKLFALVSVLSFLSGLSIISTESRGEAYTGFGWHTLLNQAGRNAAIVRETQKYANGAYGGQCKAWVQNVVWAASGQNVWLPPNSPTAAWSWMGSPNVDVLAVDRWDGIPMPPGTIIQALISTKTAPFTAPHTMIVLSANATGITIIESNYWNWERVDRRSVTWAEFKRDIIHYTLYQVR